MITPHSEFPIIFCLDTLSICIRLDGMGVSIPKLFYFYQLATSIDIDSADLRVMRKRPILRVLPLLTVSWH